MSQLHNISTTIDGTLEMTMTNTAVVVCCCPIAITTGIRVNRGRCWLTFFNLGQARGWKERTSSVKGGSGTLRPNEFRTSSTETSLYHKAFAVHIRRRQAIVWLQETAKIRLGVRGTGSARSASLRPCQKGLFPISIFVQGSHRRLFAVSSVSAKQLSWSTDKNTKKKEEIDY